MKTPAHIEKLKRRQEAERDCPEAFAQWLADSVPPIPMMAAAAEIEAAKPKRYRATNLLIDGKPIELDLVEITDVPPTPEPQPEPPPPGPIADGLLTQERLDGLKRSFANNTQIARTVRSLADNDGAYNQQGEWATLVWLGTGDPTYAQKAWMQFKRRWVDPMDWSRGHVEEGRSDTREFLVTMGEQYKWCRPGLTDEQAKEWRDLLFVYTDLCLGSYPPWGTRPNDDDECLGHCAGLVHVAQVTAEEDPERSAAILNHPLLPVLRDAIRQFCAMAKGGEWVTADGYNSGTTKVALIGVFACGKDEFPELFEWLKEAAPHHAWTFFPDLKSTIKFGDTAPDEQFPNTGHIALAAMFAGLMGNRNERALYEILSRQQPWWIELYRVLWCIDPEEVFTEPFVPPVGFSTTNVGLSIHRGPNHMLQVFTPIDLVLADGQQLDHTSHQSLDFRLWYDGEQVLDHPIGYPPAESSYNTMICGGFGRLVPQSEEIEIVTAEATPAGCAIVWRFKHVQSQWGLPPFVNDLLWTLDFAAPNRLTIDVQCDGEHPDLVNDPYWSDQWKKWLADVVRNAPALWQAVFHTPVAPTKTATGYSWQTAGNHKVTLGTANESVVMKTTIENTPGTYAAGQLDGSQIRLLSDEPVAELKATLEVN